MKTAIVFGEPRPPQAENTLILGWNPMAPLLLRELEHYVAAGSEARVVGSYPESIEAARVACPPTERLRITLLEGDPTDRATLDRLDIPAYDHVVLISEDPDDDERTDARTLVTLLHLRDIRERSGSRFSIVSEMQDVRNRALAEITRADDFIIGDQLVSLLLTQISENKALNAVFTDLFDPEGAELYLKPAQDYVRLDREVSFATVVEAARRRGEIAIGFRQPPAKGTGRPRSRHQPGEVASCPLHRARFGYRPGRKLRRPHVLTLRPALAARERRHRFEDRQPDRRHAGPDAGRGLGRDADAARRPGAQQRHAAGGGRHPRRARARPRRQPPRQPRRTARRPRRGSGSGGGLADIGGILGGMLGGGSPSPAARAAEAAG